MEKESNIYLGETIILLALFAQNLNSGNDVRREHGL